jgi:hypothetical protein
VTGNQGSLSDVDAQAATSAGNEPHFPVSHGVSLNGFRGSTIYDFIIALMASVS